jgi:hypothetical protein
MELCLAPARNESRSFHYIEARPYRRNTVPRVGAQNKFFFLETGGHRAPNELIGTLMINEHDYPQSVVVKVACEERDRRRLANECRYLMHFSKRRNATFPKVYGQFTMIKDGIKQTILLLEYVGEPVLYLNRLTLSQQYVMFNYWSHVYTKWQQI